MHVPLSIITLATSSFLIEAAAKLETVVQWKYIDFVWPSPAKRAEAIRSGAYNSSSGIPMDVDVSRDGRIFVSMLEGRGVPARLGYVSNQKTPAGPLIQPYPGWEWFQNEDCNDSIRNVFRIAIDKCDRLWVLDTGVRDPSGKICQPKLLAFDLQSDTLLSRVIIPHDIAFNARTNWSLLANVIVETYGSRCEDTTVYMADANGYALIIWNGNTLHRKESPVFLPEPGKANVTIGSSSYNVNAGILGMSISPRILPNEPRLLYFRPIASYGLYAAEVNQLKGNVYGASVNIVGHNDFLSSQSIVHAFSSEGALFLGLTKEIAIACWNRYTPMKRENIEIVAQDNEHLRYLNGLKVIVPTPSRQEELWVLSNQFEAWAHKELSIKNFNFFISKGSVRSLISGTKCQLPRMTGSIWGQMN